MTPPMLVVQSLVLISVPLLSWWSRIARRGRRERLGVFVECNAVIWQRTCLFRLVVMVVVVGNARHVKSSKHTASLPCLITGRMQPCFAPFGTKDQGTRVSCRLFVFNCWTSLRPRESPGVWRNVSAVRLCRSCGNGGAARSWRHASQRLCPTQSPTSLDQLLLIWMFRVDKITPGN